MKDGKNFGISSSFPICLFLFLLSLNLLGMFLFCLGFFPQKVALQGFNTIENLPENFDGQKTLPKAQFKKLVMMVIDAFRGSFLYGNETFMNFTKQLLTEKQSFGFIGKAQAPTVTLPRIKALTSGGIPNFLDFLLNFKSSALQEDNWLAQFHHLGKKLIFYGDDTWLKLFPGHFTRFEGTTSFFVSDIVEVDSNVTRHLDSEFSKNDWDVMILHYLGLDHIGHSRGVYSALMKPKQEEMDLIVQKIYSHIDSSTLFILCSDHGMNEIGNHGGSSFGEISSILVFMSPKFPKNHVQFSFPKIVSQVDLVPTLCLLFGIPIPKNSFGILINELFQNDKDHLRALQINSHQQINLLKAYPTFWNQGKPSTSQIENILLKYEQALKTHQQYLTSAPPNNDLANESISLYNQFLSELQTEFTKILSNYDIYYIFIGIGFLGITSICFLFLSIIYQSQNFEIAFKFFQFRSLILLFFCYGLSYIVHQIFCVFLFSDSNFCLNSYSPIIWILLSASVVSIYNLSSIAWNFLWFDSNGLLLKVFIVFGQILHLVGLGASSIVEEEHQIWYFLSITFFLILSFYESFSWTTILMLFSGRILRAWNQTGIKWAGFPDYVKWLAQPDRIHYLNFLLLFSVLFISYLIINFARKFPSFIKSKVINQRIHFFFWKLISLPLFFQKFGMVYCFCSLFMSLLLFLNKLGDYSRTHWTSKGIYFLFFLMVFFSLFPLALTHNKKEIFDSVSRFTYLTLFSLNFIFILIHKLHNAFLFVLIQIQILGIMKTFQSNTMKFNLWTYIFPLIFLGEASFFSFGNSNSVATIDIAGAYTGLDTYNELVIGFLVGLIMYSGPLLFFIYSWLVIQTQTYRESENGFLFFKNYIKNSLIVMTILWTRHSWIVFIFSIITTLLRHHLFVWSVFSPKYIYLILGSMLHLSFTFFLTINVLYCGLQSYFSFIFSS